MAIVDPVAGPLADMMVECLRGQMALTANPPKSTCLRTGDQVDFLISLTDDECCSGLAWVRVAGIGPTSNFPVIDEDVTSPCAPLGYSVILELGAVRCAPTPSARHIPSCEQWTNVSHQVLDDAAAMRRAVLCCFDQVIPDAQWLMGTWEPIPTGGRCVGGVMPLTIAADMLDCCPDES